MTKKLNNASFRMPRAPLGRRMNAAQLGRRLNRIDAALGTAKPVRKRLRGKAAA